MLEIGVKRIIFFDTSESGLQNEFGQLSSFWLRMAVGPQLVLKKVAQKKGGEVQIIKWKIKKLQQGQNFLD